MLTLCLLQGYWVSRSHSSKPATVVMGEEDSLGDGKDDVVSKTNKKKNSASKGRRQGGGGFG